MKILVVDDTRIIVSVVEAILMQERHTVFTAPDGREGYAAFGACRPDMIITDIEMPWQDGLSMMTAIRRIQPFIPTLYMTGNPGPYQKPLNEEIERHGAGLINKPFTRSELLCSVNEVAAKAFWQEALGRTTALRDDTFGQPSAAQAQNDIASLSLAHFQREGGDENDDPNVVHGRYADGLRAGGRG
jgi:CheY-like chemotaxis protein